MFRSGSKIRKVVAIIATITSILTTGDSKYCSDILISNDISEFEKLRGCSVIVGFLRIEAIPHAEWKDFDDLSFPEVEEVKDYVLVHRVTGLVTLEKLLPNLAVIGGSVLFRNQSSLVLDGLPDLLEIGLRSLVYVPNGNVVINDCPRLDYIDTVNWDVLGPTENRFSRTYRLPPFPGKCPFRCASGYCWGRGACQTVRSYFCPTNCDVCTERSKRRPTNRCLVCAGFLDDGSCVSECPPNKYRHERLGACVTAEECSSVLEDDWFVYENDCVRACPPGYVNVPEEEGRCKGCPDEDCTNWCSPNAENQVYTVDSVARAKDLRGCTHVNGSVSIVNVNSEQVADRLRENLGYIEEITGYLKVAFSDALKSLRFLKNLRVIHGMDLFNDESSLLITVNPNLQKLWDWGERDAAGFNLSVLNGAVSVYFNPVLCATEIEKLLEFLDPNKTTVDISPYENGYETTCN